MQNPIDDLLNTGKPLLEDVVHCLNMIEQEDNQFWRRAFVRAVFAYLEAPTYCMKRIAFAARFRQDINFSFPEKVILLEQTYGLNDKGEAKAQRIKVQLSKNIRFAFRAVAHANYGSYELKVEDDGWASFKKGIKIRDRLMHPKSVKDLIVTDEEMGVMGRTLDWFADSFKEVAGVVSKSLKGKLKELEEKDSVS